MWKCGNVGMWECNNVVITLNLFLYLHISTFSHFVNDLIIRPIS